MSFAGVDEGSRVDVVSACGDNSEGYVEFLVWSILQTARRPDRFRYLLGVNHDGVDVERLRRLGDVADVEVFEAYSGLGYCSMSHGTTLDEAYARVSAPLSLVCDVDVAFVEPGWDDVYTGVVLSGHVGVGPEYARDYDRKGGRLKHLGFPNLLATMLVSAEMRRCGVSFKPGKDVLLDEATAPLYGLPPGTTTRQDTGWQLSYNLRAAGHTGVAMRMLSWGEPETKLLVGPDMLNGNEFQLGGVPIVTHMGRSSMRTFGVHRAAVAWEDRVRRWIDGRLAVRLGG